MKHPMKIVYGVEAAWRAASAILHHRERHNIAAQVRGLLHRRARPPARGAVMAHAANPSDHAAEGCRDDRDRRGRPRSDFRGATLAVGLLDFPPKTGEEALQLRVKPSIPGARVDVSDSRERHRAAATTR